MRKCRFESCWRMGASLIAMAELVNAPVSTFLSLGNSVLRFRSGFILMCECVGDYIVSPVQVRPRAQALVAQSGGAGNGIRAWIEQKQGHAKNLSQINSKAIQVYVLKEVFSLMCECREDYMV